MKKKVYLFSDNADVSNLVCLDIQTCIDIIESDNHDPNEDYEYTITVKWMTEDEYEYLSEADF